MMLSFTESDVIVHAESEYVSQLKLQSKLEDNENSRGQGRTEKKNDRMLLHDIALVVVPPHCKAWSTLQKIKRIKRCTCSGCI